MTTEEDLENAESELMIEALKCGNAIYILEIDGDVQVQVADKRYASTIRERLTFLASVDGLMQKNFVCQISDELYELTYPGWIEACRRAGQQPESEAGEIERAEQSLMVGAFNGDNAIHLTAENGSLVVSAGAYSYNDSEEQRLLYIDTLERLVKRRLAQHISNSLFELTFGGHLKALDLIEAGILQDTPHANDPSTEISN